MSAEDKREIRELAEEFLVIIRGIFKKYGPGKYEVDGIPFTVDPSGKILTKK